MNSYETKTKLNPNIHRVTIIYDAAALHGDASEQDVLEQIEAVETAAPTLGIKVDRIGIDLNLQTFKKFLLDSKPDVIVNLVESLDASDRLQAAVTMFLETWRIPFTGCGSLAMAISNEKIESKRLLLQNALPTPDCAWLQSDGRLDGLPNPPSGKSDWIIKTRNSHASLFLDSDSVLKNAAPDALAARLRDNAKKHGQPFFAEQFIDGREFNLSIIETEPGRPEVLPVAEIRFDDLPPEQPRIVGYAAKWDENSSEYSATPRTFDLGPGGEELARRLRTLALETWRVLGLAGYARVDFRVALDGTPYILEANSNPCLSPDAGFAAAAARAGLGFADLLARILNAAVG